jgi:geranylgeranyl pyrophosphate synthase
MSFEEMKKRVREIPEVAAWPQMLAMIDRLGHRESISVWEYPVAGCRAAGETTEAALPAASAVLCAVISIHLVDDMLDDDPAGDFHRLGAGPVANLALAFQAAGHRLLDQAPVPPEVRSLLHASFSEMSLATAFGQGLDARELRSEEEYWRVVEAKSPPLFGAGLFLGALLGGAPVEAARELEQVGRLLGRFIQVSDDLSDALQTPARADWNRRSNNLPILYAMTADHPDREEFLRLSSRARETEALAEAQRILLRCGAVSYCAFKMIEFSQEARELLARAPLLNPAPVRRLLEQNMRPLHRILETVGVEEPEALTVR